MTLADIFKQQTNFDADKVAEEAVTFIEKGDAATTHAQEFYAEAGKRLQRLQENKPAGVTWEIYVNQMCGISYHRAYELIGYANGKSVEEDRARKRESVRKAREKQSLLRSKGGQPTKANPVVIAEESINAVEYAKDHVRELLKGLKQSLAKEEWRAIIQWMEEERPWRRKRK